MAGGLQISPGHHLAHRLLAICTAPGSSPRQETTLPSAQVCPRIHTWPRSGSTWTCIHSLNNPIDEDITCSDITTLATFDSQVKQFFIMIVFDTFDELMLHHDVCSFSFSELLTWIKGRFDCIWKAWKVNEVDWGPNPSIPNVLHLDTTSLLVQGKKEIKSNTFWGWIRTPGQLQLVMFTMVAYGLRFGRSSTPWNPYEV